jgi:hypothetical protein
MTIVMVLILKINLGMKSRTKRMMKRMTKRMTKEKRAKMRLEVPNQPRQFVSWVLIAMDVDAATQDAVHAIDPSSLLKVSSRTLIDLAAKGKSKLPCRHTTNFSSHAMNVVPFMGFLVPEGRF